MGNDRISNYLSYNYKIQNTDPIFYSFTVIIKFNVDIYKEYYIYTYYLYMYIIIIIPLVPAENPVSIVSELFSLLVSVGLILPLYVYII